MPTQTFTYQARLPGNIPALDLFARLFGRLERKLYVDRVHRKIEINTLKSRYIAQYGISSRQFNALRISLDGRIQSVLELLKNAVAQHEQKIVKKSALIEKLQRKIIEQRKFVDSPSIPSKRKLLARKIIAQYYFRIHHLKRAVEISKHRLNDLRQRINNKNPRICFGSKKLFREQFGLDKEDEQYETLFRQWKSSWELSRNNTMYSVGSKDETAGNLSCQLKHIEDRRFSLKLRLPDAMGSEHGKFFEAGFDLKYGHEYVIAALNSSALVGTKRTGTALTYRFHKDGKGWRILISVSVNLEATTNKQSGFIGVDLNADHLAVSETDRFGNLVKAKRFDLYLNGKTSDQRQAVIGDATKAICLWARQAGKPIAMEQLNFSKKKQNMGSGSHHESRYNRMLSSLAYSQIHQMMASSALRHQVEVVQVNPAFTSVIGRVNHAARYGISTHLGAALAIARRAQNYREDLIIDNDGLMTVQCRDNHPVTLKPPVRKRSGHVWSLWSQVNTLIKRPLAEGGQCHYRRASLLNPAMSSTAH